MTESPSQIPNIESIKTYGSGLLFAFLVGFSFLSMKIALSCASSFYVLAYRYTFAMIALALCIFFGIVKVDFQGKSVIKAMPAAIAYVGFMVFQAIGMQFATSIESGIIFAISPIFAAILSAMLMGEKSSGKQIIFMMLSVVALIAMIAFGAAGFQIDAFGIIFLLLSSLSMAANNVLMRSVSDTFKPLEMTTVIVVLGFVTMNVFSLVWSIINGESYLFFSLVTNGKFLWAVLYLGIPCTLISAALMAYMTKRVVAVKATIFANLSTAISIVTGVIILKEPIYWYHILCTVVIIFGVIGVSASKSTIDSQLDEVKK